MSKGINMLCVGDPHLAPGYDSNRMTVAGQMAVHTKADVVVLIGDVGDMPSLNTHRNKLEMETSRYKDDCDAVKEGIADFLRPLHAAKKKMPMRVWIGGNHENYIRRFVEQEPKMEKFVDLERDLGIKKFGFTYHEYQDRVPIAGFHFCHNIATKTAISADVLSPKWGYKKKGVSMVCGHTHTKVMDTHPMLQDDGTYRKIHGINLGCFIHKDMGYQEHWSRNTEYTYDRGVWTFENAKFGDAKFTFHRAKEDMGI